MQWFAVVTHASAMRRFGQVMPFGSRIGPALTIAASVFLGVATFGTFANRSVLADALPTAALPIGHGADNPALPGGEHVISAEQPARLVATAFAGYGHTERIVGSPAVHERALGDLALSFAPVPALMIGATGLARFDAHRANGKRQDEGAAFGSALAARFRHELSRELALGADLTVLFPPAKGVQRGLSATSPALRALGTYSLPHHVNVSLNAGARLDRSRYAVADSDKLSVNDRIAAGLSASNAILLGTMTSARVGGFVLTGEWSWDLGIGSAAPAALASPMRVEAGVQRALAGGLFAGALVGVSPSARPRASALSRIEPRVWAGLTVGFLFERVKEKQAVAAAPATEPRIAQAPALAPQPPVPVAPNLPPGQIRGRVRSLRGKALRAQIEVLPLGQKLETDAKGAFVIDVPPGHYSVVVRAEGHEQQERPAEVEQNGVTILVVDLRRSKR